MIYGKKWCASKLQERSLAVNTIRFWSVRTFSTSGRYFPGLRSPSALKDFAQISQTALGSLYFGLGWEEIVLKRNQPITQFFPIAFAYSIVSEVFFFFLSTLTTTPPRRFCKWCLGVFLSRVQVRTDGGEEETVEEVKKKSPGREDANRK